MRVFKGTFSSKTALNESRMSQSSSISWKMTKATKNEEISWNEGSLVSIIDACVFAHLTLNWGKLSDFPSEDPTSPSVYAIMWRWNKWSKPFLCKAGFELFVKFSLPVPSQMIHRTSWHMYWSITMRRASERQRKRERGVIRGNFHLDQWVLLRIFQKNCHSPASICKTRNGLSINVVTLFTISCYIPLISSSSTF